MSALRSVAGPNADGYDGRTILALDQRRELGAGVCGAPPGTAGGRPARRLVADAALQLTDADCDQAASA